MVENFPYLVKGINIQIQEAEQTPDEINQKNSTSSPIIMKLLETRDK